ncbi:MAG TPA: hypothetical protein DIT07_12395 [Sphingobacteriaceae bacterium]|nr:hypothetical protein [Sphingobacteriaceae bacterium]
MSLNKIKIVHVQVTPIFAGAVKFSYDILSNLDKDKYELYVIYSANEPISQVLRQEFISKFEDQGIKAIGSKYLRRSIGFHDIAVFFELYHIINNIKPKIINSISSKPWVLCSILSLLIPKTRFIHTIQGLSWHLGDSFIKRKIYHAVEWLSSLANDKVVFVNRLYMQYYKYFKNKSIYIPNCLEFKNQGLRTEKGNVSEVKLLFIGRIDPQKDILTLLKAFNLVIKKSLPFKLYLDIVGDDTIGGGLELIKAQDFIKENPALEKLIKFHGWHSDVTPFLEKADIFISTSVYEGFGIVFLEAGNYYLPVISTDVDGIPEVVAHNLGGFLAPKHDYRQIANYIEILSSDKNLRLKMGNDHGQYVRKHFSKDLIVTQYDNLYTSLS